MNPRENMVSEEQILELAERLTPAQTAKVAAELLNLAGLDRDTWRVFADALDDANHGELLGWADEEAERE